MNNREPEVKSQRGGARGPTPRWLTLVVYAGLGLVLLLTATAALTSLWPRHQNESAASSALTEAAILNDPATPTLAAADADVTIVVFFDYRCPVCRQVHPILERIRKEDGRIRLVYKDWPIVAGASTTAARVAIAAHWQGKYHAVHDALMRSPGQLDEARIEAAARGVGVDWDRLRHDLATRGDEVEALLGRTHVQARGLGFQGTPSFAIGAYLVSGGLDHARFTSAIARARAFQRPQDRGPPRP